jgi:hypothetical protein
MEVEEGWRMTRMCCTDDASGKPEVDPDGADESRTTKSWEVEENRISAVFKQAPVAVFHVRILRSSERAYSRGIEPSSSNLAKLMTCSSDVEREKSEGSRIRDDGRW